jgi:hypothetical protein
MALLKLKSSSITEVTVAMVILVITFTTALSVFLRVTLGSVNISGFKYKMLAREQIIQIKKNPVIGEESIYLEGFIIDKSVQPFQNKPNLLLVHVRLTSTNKRLLYESKELIYNDGSK